MAGNNSIQILRGTSDAISKSTDTLLDGQLLYDTTKNVLYCGGGSVNKTGDGTSKPIKEMWPIYTDWRNVTNKTVITNVSWNNIRYPSSHADGKFSDYGVSNIGPFSVHRDYYAFEDRGYENTQLFQLRVQFEDNIRASIFFDIAVGAKQQYYMSQQTTTVTIDMTNTSSSGYFTIELRSMNANLTGYNLYALSVASTLN